VLRFWEHEDVEAAAAAAAYVSEVLQTIRDESALRRPGVRFPKRVPP
jgi:hypothetical protein